MKAFFVIEHTPRKACVWLLTLLLFSARSVVATDNYAYRAGEYVTISGGRSPDGHWSIAAHGDDDMGYDGFRLYLMREPTHEKLTSLRTGEHLDTAPLSIVGLWAPDSSRVAVLFRTDRHVLDIRIFGVTDGKIRPIEIPSLVDTIGQQHFNPGIHRELLSRYYRVTWQKPNRLALEEFDTYDAAGPIFRAGLENYLSVERWNAERTFTSFSASAVCEITERGKLRLTEIKPLLDRARTIVYSPHLLYDPQNGLHDTETTMSSLEAQKGQR